jgi:transposase
MVPTLAARLGVQGHRPAVPTRDGTGLPDVFAVVNLIPAAFHANTLEGPQNANQRTGKRKTRRWPEAFAAHRRHRGRVYPRERYPRVVLVIDNAPGHRGQAVTAALADNPHLEFKRLPSSRPPLNPVERFWKKLRRRATHHRLFDPRADLQASIRARLRYFPRMRHTGKSILEGRRKRNAAR